MAFFVKAKDTRTILLNQSLQCLETKVHAGQILYLPDEPDGADVRVVEAEQRGARGAQHARGPAARGGGQRGPARAQSAGA